MKNNMTFQLISFNDDSMAKKDIFLNKDMFINVLSNLKDIDDINKLKIEVIKIINILKNPRIDHFGILNISSNGETINLDKNILLKNLEQVVSSQSFERAMYYIERLQKSLNEVKINKINDLNLNRWQEYSDIITDSLWLLDKRDSTGAHLGWYWGNFVPQIPKQMMMRYTKKGDWVLDTFLGSGTTLIECRKLGRNGIGIELNESVAIEAKKSIEREKNDYNVISDIIVGDSKNVNIKEILLKHNINEVQLIIMHPPYHNIIKFSENEKDLSNAKSIEEFLKMFGDIVDNVTPFLEKNRYLVLVIGDKYSKGEWIPLGFYCMEEVLKRKYMLKSIIVKNFEETRGKRNQKELWRYRALVGGFYVFKHEYIMLFKKR